MGNVAFRLIISGFLKPGIFLSARIGHRRAARIFDEAAKCAVSQVQPTVKPLHFKLADDAQPLRIPFEMPQIFKLRSGQPSGQFFLGKARCGEPFIDRILARMAEWRVADIMGKARGLHHVTDIGDGDRAVFWQVFDDMRTGHQA